MDDVHTVTSSSNVVVCGDSVAVRPCSRPGGDPTPTCEASPKVDILTTSEALPRAAASFSADKDRNSSFTRSRRGQHNLSGKISVNNDVRLQTPVCTTTPAVQEMDFPGSASAKPDAAAPSVRALVEICEATAVSRVSICSEAASVAMVMPEVEPDKPAVSRQSSHSPGADGRSLGNRARSLSLSCSSLDRKLAEGASDVASTGGGAESDDGGSIESRSLRRHSYELAYQHGRISPTLFDEAH